QALVRLRVRPRSGPGQAQGQAQVRLRSGEAQFRLRVRLSTWTGPAWSPAQSISSVLISIQSLMTENPYHNEPGFE
ncbi:hypothetical protein DV515_00019583, partial [Chloebia gouldiae]